MPYQLLQVPPNIEGKLKNSTNYNNNIRIVAGVIGLFFIVHLVLIFRLDYTTDAGDSINHFLYAKWAFVHPENFVDHWAKPLFVLLSASFAQFGFEGMSIFNLLVYVGALVYTDKFCRRIGIIYSCVPVTLMAVFVFSNQIVHSGLTEPLGCLLMITSCYYLSARKYLVGTIIMSFSPIWDNWFSVVENGVPYEKLSSDTTLRYIAEFKQSDENGEARIVAFEKK